MFTPPHNNTIYQQQQQQQQQHSKYTPVDMATSHIMNMEIDDYFTPNTTIDSHQIFANSMQNVVYSPSSTSVTTNNSSIMMMDTMSPSSPTHNMMMSPEYATRAMVFTKYTTWFKKSLTCVFRILLLCRLLVTTNSF
jgi:hypothetical protein